MTNTPNFQLVSFSDVNEQELNKSSHSSQDHFQIMVFEYGNWTLLIDFKECHIQ